jgi:glycine/D-amino acid oxidase-like deaminating enzyme
VERPVAAVGAIPAGAPAWEDGSWTTLPALAGDLVADACVIGLGGSGLAAIEALVARGCRVVGLEARQVGAGAAGRNGGLLLGGGAPFHHDAVDAWGADAAVAVYRATLEELDRMVAAFPRQVRRTGSLRLAADDAEREDCERQLVVMREHGLPVERHAGAEGVGLCFPDDAVFDPLASCRATASRMLAAGARLHEATTAVAIETGRVACATGSVTAPLILVAVDGGLARVLPMLAERVQPVRLQMLATEPTREVRLSRPVYANYGYDYWQQLADGRLLLGGGRHAHRDAEATDVETISPGVQAYLDGVLRDRIGVPTAQVTTRWAGIVSYTPDWRPIIAEVMPGVWGIGGYSGTGNLVGRRVARGVVALALDGSDALLQGFRP